MRSTSILFLTYDGLTDPLGSSQIIPYLLNLTKDGIEISVISFEKSRRMNKSGNRIRSLLNQSNIKWHPLNFSNKIPILSKIYDLYKFREVARHLAAKGNFNLVHCRSYVSAQVGNYLKEEYGIPVLFDTRGFWVDERVDKNIWNLSNPIFRGIYWWYKRKETQMYLNADLVLTLTETAKGKIILKYNVAEHRIKTIPCATEAQNFTITTEDKRILAKKRLGLIGNEYCLGYLGSLGGWYDLSSMLDFYVKYRKWLTPSRFIFFTPQSQEYIENNCLSKGIDPSEIIVRYINHDELDAYLDAFDLSILFIKKCPSRSACSPTRIGELWSKGIPVIVNSGIGDLDQTYSLNMLGRFYEVDGSFDRHDLQTYLNTEADKLRALSLQYFNFQEAISIYLECYNELRK